MRSSKVIVILVFLALLAFFVSSTNVSAQTEQDKINNAYRWLADNSEAGWGNTETNAFSVMGLHAYYESDLLEEGIQNLKNSMKNGANKTVVSNKIDC